MHSAFLAVNDFIITSRNDVRFAIPASEYCTAQWRKYGHHWNHTSGHFEGETWPLPGNSIFFVFTLISLYAQPSWGPMKVVGSRAYPIWELRECQWGQWAERIEKERQFWNVMWPPHQYHCHHQIHLFLGYQFFFDPGKFRAKLPRHLDLGRPVDSRCLSFVCLYLPTSLLVKIVLNPIWSSLIYSMCIHRLGSSNSDSVRPLG